MVSFPCLEFHKDVVYINLHAVVYHIMERWPSWLKCSSILKSEWHDNIAVGSPGFSNDVLSGSSLASNIWLYPEKASMNENIS